MKKLFCTFLSAVLAVCALTGCAAPAPQSEAAPIDGASSAADHEPTLPPSDKLHYTADNEIFTYTPINPEKTQLFVSRTGNFDLYPFCKAFEAQNPDVQILYLDITGGNQFYNPLIDWIDKGFAPDIVFSATGFADPDLTIRHFQNMSDDPLIANYEMEALQRTATQSNIYWLPGPSNICAMTYNKTLFDQYGWQVPHTFDEFVALCLQIREDTNGQVEPWNPNAKYSHELMTALQGMTYEELFGGAENRAWYNDFITGNATYAGHMEPYYRVVKTLSDNDILREEHFSYSATTRGKEFAAGKIAMINGAVADFKGAGMEFAYMPFPTTKGEIGYINDIYSCYVGVPIKERTEAQVDAVDRFLTFFSSPEGQAAYIGDSLKISSVKNTPMGQKDNFGYLQSAIDAGHLFAVLDFSSETAASNIELWRQALDLTTGTKSMEDCIAEADATPFVTTDASAAEPPQAVAKAAEDFTILETSFYIADTYRQKAGADIALINNNEAFRGNLMRIFAGDITPGIVTVLKPRSFANDSTLVKLSMTGEQILGALNAPLSYDDTVSDSIYAYSGLSCTVAPWNALGEKYISVKLADGSALEPDKLYTVACWAGSVGDAFITETLESIPGSFEEILSEKLTADGTIKPADDGRIELIWK